MDNEIKNETELPLESTIEQPVPETTETVENVETAEATTEEKVNLFENEKPLDKNVKLMSPTRMILRRFFRSRLSIIGLIMIVGLFVFCWLGPAFYT